MSTPHPLPDTDITIVDDRPNLGTKSIGRLLWMYSLPTIIGTLANALYNIVDRIFIGQGVGAMAISGLALTFPIMNILGAFGMLIGQGAAAQVSIYLGKKNSIMANRILGNAFILSFIIAAIVSTACYLCIEPMLKAFGGSEQTIPFAKQYLSIIIPFNLFTSLSWGMNNIMRAAGHPTKAMLTLMIGAGVNVILDPIFIFVFDWGIQGAAIATVISMVISSTWVIVHFTNKKHEVHFQRDYFKLNGKAIKKILYIGMSPFCMQIAASLVNVLMNHTLIHHGGDLAVGAYGIISSFVTLIVMAIIGLTNGMQPIIGYNFGANQYDRVIKTLHYGIIIASILTTIGFIISHFWPMTIARAFTKDETLLAITNNGFKLAMSLFMFCGAQIVISNFFQSIGKAKWAIFLSLSRQILFLLPFLFFFPSIWGLDGAWLSITAADGLSFIITIILVSIQIRKLKAHQPEAPLL